ncbi:hypothetical protein V1224_02235 [Lachnospiraceae bacterium JLR.KK008]
MKKGLISVVSGIAGAATGIGLAGRMMGKQVKRKSEFAEKHLALYLLMNQWVQVKQDGKSLVSYFEEKGYHKIAVYGMNYVGQTLCRELENSSVTVQYAIDQNAETICADCPVVRLEDELEEVDAIVVTPIYYFDEIEEKLMDKVDCPVVSVEDIVYEI